MKEDIRKTLEACYARGISWTSAEYYVTPQYRHYREKLAETWRKDDLLNALDNIVQEVFPDREMATVHDLITSPEVRFVQYPPEQIFGEEGAPAHALMLHVSGLGPYWHLEVVTFESLDEEFIDQFVESSIPESLAPQHEQLRKHMSELGYREVTADEAWEPVEGFDLGYVDPQYHRVGHFLFSRESSFGVEGFEDILMGTDELDLEFMESMGIDPEGDIEEQLAQMFTEVGSKLEEWEDREEEDDDEGEDDKDVTLH